MIKWVFCSLWLLSIIAFFIGQSLAPSNYALTLNELWGIFFLICVIFGIIFFLTMAVFITIDFEKKINQKRKIRCNCGIFFIPEEGQTHCDYCGAKISNIDKKKINPKKKIKNDKAIKEDVPKRFLTILLGLAILFSTGLYTRAENMEKEIKNKEFKSNPTPTPTILQPSPTPKLKSKTKESITPTQTNNLDPIITCNVHTNCGGGSKQMKKSECDQTTCCKIGDKWYFYLSKEKCKQDQNSYWSNYYKEIFPIPTKFPTYSPSQPTPTKVPAPTPTINQAAIDEYNQLLKEHKEACDAAVADWIRIKNEFMETQYNNYSSSVEAMMTLEQMRQNYQQELYDAGCSNTIHL